MERVERRVENSWGKALWSGMEGTKAEAQRNWKEYIRRGVKVGALVVGVEG